MSDRLSAARTATEAAAGEVLGERSEVFRRILAAATTLFSAKGFHGTTTRELAEASGLTKGALYYYIASKEDVLFHIHQEVMNASIESISAALERCLPAAEALRAVIEAHIRNIRRLNEAIVVLNEEAKHLGPETWNSAVELRENYASYLEQAISRSAEQGDFEIADVRIATLALLGLLNSVYRWYDLDHDAGPDALAAEVSDLVLDGLLA